MFDVQIIAMYSKHLKSERSDFGAFGNGLVPKQFRNQTLSEIWTPFCQGRCQFFKVDANLSRKIPFVIIGIIFSRQMAIFQDRRPFATYDANFSRWLNICKDRCHFVKIDVILSRWGPFCQGRWHCVNLEANLSCQDQCYFCQDISPFFKRNANLGNKDAILAIQIPF